MTVSADASQEESTWKKQPNNTSKTMRTRSCAGSNSIGAFGDLQAVHSMLGSLWASVTLESPAPNEQLDILLASFPTLPREVVAGGLGSLLLCQVVGGVESVETSSLPPGWDAAVDSALSAADLHRGELVSAFGRHFSLRDLFKLCSRMEVSELES